MASGDGLVASGDGLEARDTGGLVSRATGDLVASKAALLRFNASNALASSIFWSASAVHLPFRARFSDVRVSHAIA